MLVGGNRVLDAMDEKEAEKKVRDMLAKMPTAMITTGSVWLQECSPGCLCHKDCKAGACVYGYPLRRPAPKLAGIFKTPPPAKFRGRPIVTGRRTLAAGAEGSGGGWCVDNLIDKVMNGYVYQYTCMYVCIDGLIYRIKSYVCKALREFVVVRHHV